MEEKLLIARAEDMFRLCERYASPRFSGFLDEGEQALLRGQLHAPIGIETEWFGGKENSRRKVLGVFCEWETERSFPITAVVIEKTYKKELSHRDYLGSILGLGIERSKVGDILISGDTAYAFALSDTAEYIERNLTKIGSQGVKIQLCKPEEVPDIEEKTIMIEDTVSSQRLDAVLAAAAKLSRSQAASLVRSGRVMVNHLETDDISRLLKEGDVLSVRGYGRFIYRGLAGQTRKGRFHIRIEKYI